MPSDVASSSMHCSDVGSAALASHTRPSEAQMVSQLCSLSPLTHCWLLIWLEHEGPRETGGGGEGEGGGGLGDRRVEWPGHVPPCCAPGNPLGM